MNELRAISAAAKTNQNFIGRDRFEYADRLSAFAVQLRENARKLSPEMAREFNQQADWAHIRSQNLRTDPEMNGSVAFFLQMVDIQRIADRYLKTSGINQRSEPQLFIDHLKELRRALFEALQHDDLIPRNAGLTEVSGDSTLAIKQYFFDIDHLIGRLNKKQFENFLIEWDNLKRTHLKDPKGAIVLLKVMIEALTQEECTPDQLEQLRDAILEDSPQLLELMLSIPLDTLPDKLKVKIVKLAIDQESTNPLSIFADCDWFSDMSLKAFQHLIEYAEKKGREGHKQIILKSDGYDFNLTNPD